ncbi:hypothetical protein SKAU_G00240160 [Synaphobranchus kaupii]|uniref:Uncharacterized protein n=1 Tax=Synaphobranchus kaupii TaxID=118154 RepID=A0A9Q1IT93_SYNKA|nr:hypothetical protein SKAU_G00240160 [Synaphobranchus kaupii]
MGSQGRVEQALGKRVRRVSSERHGLSERTFGGGERSGPGAGGAGAYPRVPPHRRDDRESCSGLQMAPAPSEGTAGYF